MLLILIRPSVLDPSPIPQVLITALEEPDETILYIPYIFETNSPESCIFPIDNEFVSLSAFTISPLA